MTDPIDWRTDEGMTFGVVGFGARDMNDLPQNARETEPESEPVIRMLGESRKLTERQRWYLAEGIANEIGHTLTDDSPLPRLSDGSGDDAATWRENAHKAVSEILCGKPICTDEGDWLCPQDIDCANEMIAEIVVKVSTLASPLSRPVRGGGQ